MTAFSSSVPHFRATFSLGTTNHLSLTDLITTGYSAYTGYSAVKGIFKAVDPDGITFYQNAGWSLTAPSFSSPDIASATSTWTKASIDLPLSSSGAVKRGLYRFYYIISIDGGSTFVNTVDADGNFPSYDFEYVSPDVTITYDLSCRTSELTSTDATEYDVTIGGTVFTPATETRSHTIVQPQGSGFSPAPGTTADASRTIGGGGTATTDLWTRVWTTLISTDLVYNLDTWGIYTWIVVEDTVTGSNFIDVQCKDCPCIIRQCMQNLISRWLSAKNGNRKLELDLESTVLEAIGYWVEYQTDIECGVDPEVPCNALTALLASVDCTCAPDTNAASERVVAWGNGGGGGSTPSTFQFTVSALNPSGGNSGDVHYNTATYHIWHNNGGTWVDDGSIRGATGAAGTNGTNGTAADVLDNDPGQVNTSAGTLEESLITYAFDSVTYMGTQGDSIEITATYKLESNGNGKTIKLYWGGDVLISFFTDALINSTNQYVELWARVNRSAGGNQVWTSGVRKHGYIDYPVWGSSSEDLSLGVLIQATGQNSVPSAGDIMCESLYVVSHLIVPAP